MKLRKALRGVGTAAFLLAAFAISNVGIVVAVVVMAFPMGFEVIADVFRYMLSQHYLEFICDVITLVVVLRYGTFDDE